MTCAVATVENSSRRSAAPRTELVEDWAVWSVVAMAGCDQPCEDFGDEPVRVHAIHDRLSVHFRQCSDLSAGAVLVAPELQELVDVIDREPQRSRFLYESQFVHIALVEHSVAARAPSGCAEQPPIFIVADHLGRNSRKLRRLSDPHDCDFPPPSGLTFQPLEGSASPNIRKIPCSRKEVRPGRSQ